MDSSLLHERFDDVLVLVKALFFGHGSAEHMPGTHLDSAFLQITLLSHGFLSVLLAVCYPARSAYIITRYGCQALLGALSLP